MYRPPFFPASRFPCPCCLNTADDTSDWEKFEIISDFDFLQRQRNSKLPPSTVFVRSCRLICRCWSLLCLSAGGPHWLIASLRSCGKTNLSICFFVSLVTYSTFDVPAFHLRWIVFLLLPQENNLWQIQLKIAGSRKWYGKILKT